MDAEQTKQEMDRIRKEMFRAYLATPGTRVLMSLIPAGEKQEILQALLETTFETGFSGGIAATSIHLIGGAISRLSKD